MNLTDWIGFTGVSILLLAYLLSILNYISKDGLFYSSLNVVGAGLACISAILLEYLPFIILEGVWTLVSLFFCINYFLKK